VRAAAEAQLRASDDGTVSAPCPALGFLVDLEPVSGLSAERVAELRAGWTAFLDARGLCARERRVGARLQFEVESEASQATQNDRDAAQSWLSGRSELRRWRVGDIQDLRPDA
jgi:hypothetical protein